MNLFVIEYKSADGWIACTESNDAVAVYTSKEDADEAMDTGHFFPSKDYYRIKEVGLIGTKVQR